MKKMALMMLFITLSSTMVFADDYQTIDANNANNIVCAVNSNLQPADLNASDYINTYYNSIESTSKGKVTVHADIDCKDTTSKNKITITLYSYNGSTWSDQTKTKTTTGTYGVFDTDFTVTSGSDCYAYITYEALNSSGRVLDSRTDVSSMVTAK